MTRGSGRSRQLLIKRTEGNPFFLEESVRTLVETKALAGDRGGYRLAREVYAIQVPATVQAVLAARIDRLPAEAKRLLQAAAVIGTDVPLALLHAITDLPEDMLRRHLTQLQAAEFIYEISLFPSVEYTFKHALTHDVAYSTLLQERRRALHARDRGGHRAPARGPPRASRWSGWPTTRCAARSGTRRSPTCARRAPRRRGAPPIARR